MNFRRFTTNSFIILQRHLIECTNKMILMSIFSWSWAEREPLKVQGGRAVLLPPPLLPVQAETITFIETIRETLPLDWTITGHGLVITVLVLHLSSVQLEFYERPGRWRNGRAALRPHWGIVVLKGTDKQTLWRQGFTLPGFTFRNFWRVITGCCCCCCCWYYRGGRHVGRNCDRRFWQRRDRRNFSWRRRRRRAEHHRRRRGCVGRRRLVGLDDLDVVAAGVEVHVDDGRPDFGRHRPVTLSGQSGDLSIYIIRFIFICYIMKWKYWQT